MDEMENFDNLEIFFFFTSNKSEYDCLVKNLEQSEFETQN